MRLDGVPLALCLCLPFAGCGGDEAGSRTLTVFAAASLTDAFADIEAAFEAAEDGVDVVIAYAGSSALREQILAGAPADVFAAADPASMDAVTAASKVFATNGLQIAVPAGNEAGVDGLDDLADPALSIGLCAEDVPCGRFAREALTAAGVTPAVDTDAPDVRALLTLIETGELDAGVLYRTDVLAAGAGVRGIGIPDEHDVAVEYPIAVLEDAPEPALAAAFVDFVLGATGRRILDEHGFGTPP